MKIQLRGVKVTVGTAGHLKYAVTSQRFPGRSFSKHLIPLNTTGTSHCGPSLLVVRRDESNVLTSLASCPSVCLSVLSSVQLYLCPSVLSFCLYVCLLSFHPPLRPPVCLSVFLSGEEADYVGRALGLIHTSLPARNCLSRDAKQLFSSWI